MNKLLQSVFFSAIAIITVIMPKAVQGRELAVDVTTDATSNPVVCTRSGDKNKGHGNDPYVEFTVNISKIGSAQISGDFDLDNPGKSLDKQMAIISSGQKIQWASLSDLQKQEIKDQWAKRPCTLDTVLFSD